MQRILVIEDDRGLNEYICDLLVRAGFQVASAPDGIEGLAQYNSFHPDIIILDIFMPRKGGLETLFHLRRNKPDIKVLATTGKPYLMPSCSLKIAQLLGATRTLAKPFTGQDLLNSLSDWTDLAKAA